MKKLALPLFLGILVISALVWGLMGPGGDTDVDPVDPTGTVNTGGGEDLKGDRDPDDDRTPAGGGRRKLGPGRRARTTITVRGRCVAAESKLPLSGCRVDVAGVRRRFERHRSKRPPTTEAPAVHTGPDGRFEVELDLPAQHHIRLTTKMNGRADMQGFLTHRQGIADAGQIAIPTGVRLVARVLDEKSMPQPGVGFRFYRAVTGARTPITPLNWLNYESDSVGSFESDVLMASGYWNVTANASVRIVKPGARIEIPGDTAIHETTFVVQLPDPKAMITGKLVDENDRPVPNVAVQADDGSQWPIGYGTSDQDGKFQVRCRTKPGKPVRLAVPRAAGFETLRTPETYPWGSTNVALKLQRAGTLTVKVVQLGGDRPIEDFQVVWYRVNDSGVGGYLGGRERMAHHPDGEAFVKGVPGGKIRVVVMPQGKDFAPNDPYEFVKGAGDSEIRIALAARVELPVKVVDRNANPIAGTRLQLVRATDDKPVTLNSYAVDHSQYPQFSHPNSYALLLDNVVTDKTGAAWLRWSPSGVSLAIRVLGPGHVPMVHAPVTIAAENDPVEIVVSSGATLSGNVAPLSVLESLLTKSPNRKFAPQSPTIILTYRDVGGPQGTHRTKSTRVDDKGQFKTVGLHPGKWDITFRVWRFGAGRGSNVSTKKFDAVELRSDEDRRITLDIADMQPSTLRGQVFFNGVPWAGKGIHLTRIKKSETRRFIQVGNQALLTTDERGAFVAEGIQPGTYRVGIDIAKGAPQARRLVSSSTADVPPGGSVDRTFDIESGKLRVRLLDKDKKPVPKQYVTVHHKESGYRTGAATGADGWMEIDPIAIGTYSLGVFPRVRWEPGRLRAPRRTQEIVLGETTVTIGSRREVVLTMPDPEKQGENKDKRP